MPDAPVPKSNSLRILAALVCDCHACGLYRYATQPVFGEGPENARIVFVGEQPGDQEDRQGKPFVGPAGQIFDTALAEAEIPRKNVYVTNAVKHFKFEERGKRRIHKKPEAGEIAACRPWLTAELARIRPDVVVALGATAARSLMGRLVAVQKERGRFLPFSEACHLLVTVHPSFLLRVPGPDRHAEFGKFVADLRLVAARQHGTESVLRP